MKTRTKVFLGALFGSVVVASVVAGQPKMLVDAAILFVVAWLLWRGFVFMAVLIAPVRETLKPINDHIDVAMRQSGLGKIADINNAFQAGVDSAIKSTLKKVHDRNK